MCCVCACVCDIHVYVCVCMCVCVCVCRCITSVCVSAREINMLREHGHASIRIIFLMVIIICGLKRCDR